MNAESAPKGASQIVAPQRDHLEITSDLLRTQVDDAARDGDGRFAVGQAVVTRANVRPARYGGKAGVIVSVNRRDRECGVAWGRATVDIARAAVDAWFRADDLAPANGVETRPAPRCGSAKPSVVVGAP